MFLLEECHLSVGRHWHMWRRIVLALFRDSTYGGRGKVPIRSHVIEASGLGKVLHVPPSPLLSRGLTGCYFELAVSFLG